MKELFSSLWLLWAIIGLLLLIVGWEVTEWLKNKLR